MSKINNFKNVKSKTQNLHILKFGLQIKIINLPEDKINITLVIN